MSKDMLGPVIRAAVGVPQKRLDTLAKIASKLSGDHPEADAWHARLGKILEGGLSDADTNSGVVRSVEVNRSRSPQEALDASGRRQYVDTQVVAAIPRGEGKQAKLVYFKPDPSAYRDGWLSCKALAAEYKKRGLKADPQAQIDDNAANPEFADGTPNACQWIDAQGNYCYAAFSRWSGERDVCVGRGDDGWNDDWSFAGVPEASSASVA